MGFTIEDKYLFTWLQVSSKYETNCFLEVFLTEDGVASLTHVRVVVDHTLPIQLQISTKRYRIHFLISGHA